MAKTGESIEIIRPNRDLSLLAPFFREMVLGALNELQLMGHDVDVYEGYRTPERQAYLYKSSTPERWVTSALPYQSAHQFGVAADLIAKVNGKWSWDSKLVPYKEFRKVYTKHGLQLLNGETAHVQYLGKFTNEDLKNYVIRDLVKERGIQYFWDAVSPQSPA